MQNLRMYLIKYWLPVAIAGTVIMVTLYASIQQSIRMAGNDPQIQLAQDGAAALEAGQITPQQLIGSTKIDMHASLAPFVIIYDDNGKVIASSGYLYNQVPTLPKGVFDYSRTATDRITWQPASTTRIAAVVKHFGGNSPGFIAAGRNMREMEAREHQIGLMDAAAWVGLLALTFIVVLYVWAIERKNFNAPF